MSEKMPEQLEQYELMEAPEEHLMKFEKHENEGATSESEKVERQRKNLEYLRKHAEIHAKNVEELKLDETKDNQPEKPKPIGQIQKEKAEKYQAKLSQVRARLNPASQKFSRLIHNPSVESASELASKTIARPSSFIGGGLVSFIGSGLVLFMAKRYGFEYNYLVFLGLFIIGFFSGITVEFSFRALRKHH